MCAQEELLQRERERKQEEMLEKTRENQLKDDDEFVVKNGKCEKQ